MAGVGHDWQHDEGNLAYIFPGVGWRSEGSLLTIEHRPLPPLSFALRSES